MAGVSACRRRAMLGGARWWRSTPGCWLRGLEAGRFSGGWIAAAVVIGIVVLAGFAVRNSSGGGNFEMIAYQGAAQLGGSTVEFDDVKLTAAGKPIVLNFWGGSCPPCRAEMPGFQRVYERNRDDFLMIGLDVGPFFGLGTRNSALSLLDELGITYPAAYATSRGAISQFGATALPSTFFFDGNGDLVESRIGFIGEAEFESKLRSLIGAPTAKAAPGEGNGA